MLTVLYIQFTFVFQYSDAGDCGYGSWWKIYVCGLWFRMTMLVVMEGERRGGEIFIVLCRSEEREMTAVV